MCLTVDQDFALDDVSEKCRHCCVIHKRLELSSQFTGQVRDECLTPFKIQSNIILSDQLTHYQPEDCSERGCAEHILLHVLELCRPVNSHGQSQLLLTLSYLCGAHLQKITYFLTLSYLRRAHCRR